jgi:CelD/BcsL family acetyltransferase involved in cellulose biosynthesis
MLMTRDAQLAPERLHLVRAACADLDLAAEAADPAQAFLRGAWYSAGEQADLFAVVRGDGRPLAGFGLTDRRVGPFRMREVAGSYWPFRSVPLAADASASDVEALLGNRDVQRTFGPIWRLGPVLVGDVAATRLRAAAPAAGWAVLERRLGTCFEIDIRTLSADGPWPRGPTLRKNRWRERRLGELGAVEIRRFTGEDWSTGDRDAIAQIERNSWLAGEAKAGLQFADARQRRVWESVAEDPALAAMLHGSILSVGAVPAAFTFGLQVDATLYQIANNYDARFAEHSAGRILLTRDFEQAAHRGVERISWGSGDAGYKSEMGADAGPEIVDLLFVRSKALAWLLRRFWK